MEPASLWYALLIAVFAIVVALGVLVGHRRGNAAAPRAEAEPHDPTLPGVRHHADEERHGARR